MRSIKLPTSRPQRSNVAVPRAHRRREMRAHTAAHAHGDNELSAHEQLDAGLAAKPFQRVSAANFQQNRQGQQSSSEEQRGADLIRSARELRGEGAIEIAFVSSSFEVPSAFSPVIADLAHDVLARVPDDPELALDLKFLLEHPSFAAAREDTQRTVLQHLVPSAMARTTRRAYVSVAVSDGFRTLNERPQNAALALFRTGSAHRHTRLAADLCRLVEEPQFQSLRRPDQVRVIEEYGRQLTDPEARLALFSITCSPHKSARRDLFRLLKPPQSFSALSAPIRGLSYRLLAHHQTDADARRVFLALISSPGFVSRKPREQIELIDEVLGANLELAKQWLKSFRPVRARAIARPAFEMPRAAAQPSAPLSSRTARTILSREPSAEKLTVRALSKPRLAVTSP